MPKRAAAPQQALYEDDDLQELPPVGQAPPAPAAAAPQAAAPPAQATPPPARQGSMGGFPNPFAGFGGFGAPQQPQQDNAAAQAQAAAAAAAEQQAAAAAAAAQAQAEAEAQVILFHCLRIHTPTLEPARVKLRHQFASSIAATRLQNLSIRGSSKLFTFSIGV